MKKVPVITEGLGMLFIRMEPVKPENLRSSFVKAMELFKDKPQIIAAEVGVYEGVNAKYMLALCDKLKLYLVDAWDNIVTYTGGPVQKPDFMEQIKTAARLNLFVFQERAVFIGKNSEDAHPDFCDGFFDYVYIDGDHDYEPAKRDMQLWWPKVRKGGILGGHDIAMEEVRQAIQEFTAENNIDTWNMDDYEKGDGRSDWWIYK